MTRFGGAAIGRAHAAILLAAAVGLAAAASIALFVAASGVAVGWPHTSLTCLPCISDALYNQYGIPGAIFGGVAAAVVTTSVLGLPTPGTTLFTGGALANPDFRDGIRDTFGRDEGDNVTTYIPGVTPLPEKGDRVYFPGQGASKVTNVYYDPDTYHPDGTPGGVIIETELGNTLVVGIDLDEQ
jgi:hypothetical protein